MKSKVKIFVSHGFDDNAVELWPEFKDPKYVHLMLKDEWMNPWIGEMSMMYMLSQNEYDAEYIGMCHYSKALKFDESQLEANAILCYREPRFDYALRDQFALYHDDGYARQFFNIFQNRFHDKWPKFCKNCNWLWIKHKVPFYSKDLTVMPKDMWIEYQKFMKDVCDVGVECLEFLPEVMQNDKYDCRMPAFMAERMTSIWLNIKKETSFAKLVECPIVNIPIRSPYQRSDENIERLKRKWNSL